MKSATKQLYACPQARTAGLLETPAHEHRKTIVVPTSTNPQQARSTLPSHIANAPCVGYTAGGKELVEIKIEIMGRWTLSRATREDAAEMEDCKRRWHAHCTKLESKIATASRRYKTKPSATNRKKLLGAIDNRVVHCASHERAEVIAETIVFEPSEIFWPTITRYWSLCDASHHVVPLLLRLMRDHRRSDRRAWMGARQLKLFDALPNLVEVWRGTDRKRVRSISWSTSRNLAERFATGMRGGSFADPVIAHAFVPKEHIFWASNDRDEQEIVLDPKRLRTLTIENFDDGLRGRAGPAYANKSRKR